MFFPFDSILLGPKSSRIRNLNTAISIPDFLEHSAVSVREDHVEQKVEPEIPKEQERGDQTPDLRDMFQAQILHYSS